MNKHFLVVIVNNVDNSEIKDYIISARDWYYASHIGASKFKNEQKYQPSLRKITNWYADSCEI